MQPPNQPRRSDVLLLSVVVSALVLAATLWSSADERWTTIFAARIGNYVSMRQQAVDEVGALTTSGRAREIVSDSRELANRIVVLRRGSAEGEIFGPPVASGFRAALAARLQRPDGDRLLADIAEVQPERFAVRVNSRYPGDEPVATTPGLLLAVLPALPDVLAYRFVGQNLLLLDRNTRLIIDVLRDALPPRDAR